MKLLASKKLNVVKTTVNEQVVYDSFDGIVKTFDNCISISENLDTVNNSVYYHITVETDDGYAYYDLYADEYLISII